MANYRYSVPQFRKTLAVASAMTAMIAGLVWMLFTGVGSPYAFWWAAIAALVFFALISVGMLTRYLRREPVLSIQPTGLYDARMAERTVPWDEIREIVLLRLEDEYQIEVMLWQSQHRSNSYERRFTIGLTSLDAGLESIVRDIGRFKPVLPGPGVRMPF